MPPSSLASGFASLGLGGGAPPSAGVPPPPATFAVNLSRSKGSKGSKTVKPARGQAAAAPPRVPPAPAPDLSDSDNDGSGAMGGFSLYGGRKEPAACAASFHPAFVAASPQAPSFPVFGSPPPIPATFAGPSGAQAVPPVLPTFAEGMTSGKVGKGTRGKAARGPAAPTPFLPPTISSHPPAPTPFLPPASLTFSLGISPDRRAGDGRGREAASFPPPSWWSPAGATMDVDEAIARERMRAERKAAEGAAHAAASRTAIDAMAAEIASRRRAEQEAFERAAEVNAKAAADAAAIKAAHAIARERFSAKDFAGAHKSFSDMLALQPTHSIALGNRAACAMMMGAFVEAVEDTKAAIAADPLYLSCYGRQARAHLALGDSQSARATVEMGIAASQKAPPGSALEGPTAVLRELLVSITNAQAALDEAATHLRRHAGALARSALNRAADCLPDIIHCWGFLRVAIACACTHERAYARVLSDFLPLLPDCLEGTNAKLASCTSKSVPWVAVDVAVLCAWAAWGGEEPDVSSRVLSAALRADPVHKVGLDLHRRLSGVERCKAAGNRAFTNEDWSTAIRHYEAALACLPSDVPLPFTGTPLLVPAVAASLYSNKAAALSAAGRHAAAVQAASSALSSWPQHMKAQLRRARARVECEDFAGARSDFTAVLEAVQTGQVGAGKGGRTDATPASIRAELAAMDARRRTSHAGRGGGRQGGGGGRGQGWDYYPGWGEFEEEEEEEETWVPRAPPPRHGGGGGRAKPARPPPPPPPKPADHFAVLGVPRGAAGDELKSAYKRAALRTHPDKAGGTEEAFKAVNEAHSVLTDAVAKAGWEADVREWNTKYRR
jgi:tetratricopeptide (TPR) repeat protein